MDLSPDVMALLRQGHTLAARASASREGWHAWVCVRPVMRCGGTFQETVAEWTRTRRAAGPYDETIERFRVRYVELSEWHLDDRWYLDMDIAIRERPIVDEWREVATVAELAELLGTWGVDGASLVDPSRIKYPDPPRV